MSGSADGARRSVRVVVAGRVQGVFFRDSCRERAEAAGVAGWVSNAQDGSVVARFEGPGDAVDGLLRWAHEGPTDADVASVEVSEVTDEGLSGFEVR